MRKFLLCCLAAIFAVSFITLRAQTATNVTGAWTGSIQGPDGSAFDLTFNLKQDGAILTGTVAGGQGEPLAIKNGKVDGDKISFTIDFNGATITHEGTVSGDEIKLTSKSSDGNFPGASFTLKRAKPAAGQ